MANDLLAISYRRFSWAVKLYPKPSRSVLTILLIDVALLPLSQYFVDSPNFLPVTRNENVPWNKPGQCMDLHRIFNYVLTQGNSIAKRRSLPGTHISSQRSFSVRLRGSLSGQIFIPSEQLPCCDFYRGAIAMFIGLLRVKLRSPLHVIVLPHTFL